MKTDNPFRLTTKVNRLWNNPLIPRSPCLCETPTCPTVPRLFPRTHRVPYGRGPSRLTGESPLLNSPVDSTNYHCPGVGPSPLPTQEWPKTLPSGVVVVNSRFDTVKLFRDLWRYTSRIWIPVRCNYRHGNRLDVRSLKCAGRLHEKKVSPILEHGTQRKSTAKRNHRKLDLTKEPERTESTGTIQNTELTTHLTGSQPQTDYKESLI